MLQGAVLNLEAALCAQLEAKPACCRWRQHTRVKRLRQQLKFPGNVIAPTQQAFCLNPTTQQFNRQGLDLRMIQATADIGQQGINPDAACLPRGIGQPGCVVQCAICLELTSRLQLEAQWSFQRINPFIQMQIARLRLDLPHGQRRPGQIATQ